MLVDLPVCFDGPGIYFVWVLNKDGRVDLFATASTKERADMYVEAAQKRRPDCFAASELRVINHAFAGSLTEHMIMLSARKGR